MYYPWEKCGWNEHNMPSIKCCNKYHEQKWSLLGFSARHRLGQVIVGICGIQTGFARSGGVVCPLVDKLNKTALSRVEEFIFCVSSFLFHLLAFLNANTNLSVISSWWLITLACLFIGLGNSVVGNWCQARNPMVYIGHRISINLTVADRKFFISLVLVCLCPQ